MTDKKDVGLFDYLRVIFKRWKVVFFAALFIAFIAGVVSLIVEPVYISDCTIMFKVGGGGISDELLTGAPTQLLSLAGLSKSSGVESEMEIMSSRTVLGNTVEKLGLLVDKSDIPELPDGRKVIGDIKINDTVDHGKYTIKFINDKGDFNLFKDGDILIGSGINKERFIGGGFDFIVFSQNPKKNYKIEFEVYKRYKHIMKIGNELLEIDSITTEILNLKLRYNDPKLAQNILITIIDEYIDAKYSFKYKSMEESLSLLGERVAQVERERKIVEDEMIEYQKENNVIYFGEDLSSLMDEFANLISLQAQAEIEKSINTHYLKLIEDGEITGEVLPVQISIGGVMVDPHISALNTTLGTMRAELSALRGIYTDEHPLVKGKIRAISEVQTELTESVIFTLRDKIKLFNSRISSVKTSFNKYVDTLPEEQMILARMYLKVNELGAIYEVLKTTYESKKLEALQEKSRYNFITIISPPSFIPKPESPKKKLNVIMGFLLGIGIGIVLAFASQFVDWDEYEENRPRSYWLITLPDKLFFWPLRMLRKMRGRKRR